jgi:thioredoxin reductase (NADPH)
MPHQSHGSDNILDVIIIGAGPAGLSVGIEAANAGLSYEIIERGALANSIVRYPANMTFFSTPELLAIGDVPFTTPHHNPTRLEGLTYYRNVAEYYNLRISLQEEVVSIEHNGPNVNVQTSKRTLTGRNVVVATGYFDNPNRLDIPGEDLPNVSHYYTEAAPFYRRKVIVIGSQNSAVEAALELYQAKAQVTMILRAPKFGESVKYWLKPNIENRVKAGSVHALFDTEVFSIEPDRLQLRNNRTKEIFYIESDFLFALTGYHPDVSFLKKLGINVDPNTLIPEYHPDTFETNISGVFIAGSVACGCETGTIFIENGRLHAYTIVGVIKRRLAERVKSRIIE